MRHAHLYWANVWAIFGSGRIIKFELVRYKTVAWWQQQHSQQTAASFMKSSASEMAMHNSASYICTASSMRVVGPYIDGKRGRIILIEFSSGIPRYYGGFLEAEIIVSFKTRVFGVHFV